MGPTLLGSDTLEVRVLVEGTPESLKLAVEGSREWCIKLPTAQGAKHPATSVRAHDVLWTEAKNGVLELSYLQRKPNGASKLARSLWKTIEADTMEAEEKWCSAVMEAAYDGMQPERRLRVLVNPYGGKGKARSVYEKVVEPIFGAARCTFDTTCTERPNHALDIAKELSLSYDAVVVLSGDGLIHEVINGFAQHEQPMKAFAIPIAPIPTGSANAMAINLLGLDDGFDPGIAALNAIKGKPLKHDLCSLAIGTERHFTFLSQALGLMADADLGTEHLRWMGDIRFSLGFIMGVLKLKAYPFTIQIKVVDSDKDRMYEAYHARLQGKEEELDRDEAKLEVGSNGLPVMRFTNCASSAEDGWVTFEKPVLLLYAGMVPFVARGLMQFPLAQAGSGLIDIVVVEPLTRSDLLYNISGAERGEHFWSKTHYFKATAYRVTPHAPDSELNFAVDGERYPFRAFTVECHRQLCTFLAPAPRFSSEFDMPRPKPVDLVRWPRWLRAGGQEADGLFEQSEDQHAEDELVENTRSKRGGVWRHCLPCL